MTHDLATKPLECMFCLSDIPKGSMAWFDDGDMYCSEECSKGYPWNK